MMASEQNGIHQRKNCRMKDEVSESENSSELGGLTREQFECMEKDIASARLHYGDKHDSSIPFFRKLFMRGLHEPIDFFVPLDDKPEWLDVEKVKRGRKFALENISGILFSELISTILLFSIRYALPPLIFTHATDSPFKCLTRYMSTFKRLKSWYDEDLWSDEPNAAKKNLAVVRSMHKNLHLSMSSSTKEEIDKKILLENSEKLPGKFQINKLLRKDFENIIPYKPEVWTTLDKYPKFWVSQAAMAFVQWAFAGLAVTYPEKFGIHNATEEDLSAFVHMWKALGHMLGIKDEFNICDGDLKTVRDKTKLIINLVIRPSLSDVGAEWEYMSRCLVDGGNFYMKGVTFEGVLLYIFHVLNIKTPRLKKYLSFWHLLGFYLTRFVFQYLCKIPIIPKIMNYVTMKGWDTIENASAEQLSQWKAKQFFYMTSNNN